jgi:hypothetical protein
VIAHPDADKRCLLPKGRGAQAEADQQQESRKAHQAKPALGPPMSLGEAPKPANSGTMVGLSVMPWTKQAWYIRVTLPGK